jgi:uncharacterized protein DUF5069
MPEQFPRSPYDMVGGFVFFPRMFDKIRLQASGRLPDGYHNNLGKEFDGHCRVSPPQVCGLARSSPRRWNG